MRLWNSEETKYQEWQQLLNECRSYFAIPGAVKCSPHTVKEARAEFDASLLDARTQYSDGKLSLEQFCDILKSKIEPLRKIYQFYRDRCCLPDLL